MNLPLLRAVLIAGLATAASASPVAAQVSVNAGALDRLAPTAPAAPAARTSPARPRAAAKPRVAGRASDRAADRASDRVAKPAATKPKQSAARTSTAIAPAAPPVASLPPTPTPPVKPAVTLPVSILPDAAGEAFAIPGGTRITFGPEATDLNPATAAVIAHLARTAGADSAAAFNVYAFAAGSPDDPSTPRRLSLGRALAVRAVLVNEGIDSTRIYVRALGASQPAGSPPGPANRVDVTVASTGAGTVAGQ